MTTQLEIEDPPRTAEVLSSWCAVELENETGILTVQRAVKHGYVKQNLVRVWRGPAITDFPSANYQGDFFVREAGAARNPLGFHRLLAEYLGWSLPSVPRYTGGESLLYLEVIFPFLYADQRSWGTAGPRPVTQYQLREPTRRAAEFLLGFQGPESEARRYRIEDDLKLLRASWSSNLNALQVTAASVGGRVVGVSDLPSGARSGRGAPAAPTSTETARFQLLVGQEWKDAEQVIGEIQGQLEQINAGSASQEHDSSTVQDIGYEVLRAQLEEQEAELQRLLTTAKLVEQNLTLNDRHLATLDHRISSLEDEKSRNQDVKTLLRLGSTEGMHHLADANCPTCNQSLSAAESGSIGPVLDIDATLSLISSQLRTTQVMRQQAYEAATEARSSYRAIQNAIDACRTRVRNLKSDLVSPAQYPSSGLIASRISAEVRISELRRLADGLGEILANMQEIAAAIFSARQELLQLPKDVSAEDNRRLRMLTRAVHEQLEEFGFSSYSASKVTIDEETLRPGRAGLDLDTDASASDVVRTKIAYLNGIQEVAYACGAPHPGFLLLDEPRQHELDEEHFRATLKRLALCESAQEQVIVTSAASVESLMSMLGDAQATLIDLGQKRLLQPESSMDPLDYSANPSEG